MLAGCQLILRVVVFQGNQGNAKGKVIIKLLLQVPLLRGKAKRKAKD